MRLRVVTLLLGIFAAQIAFSQDDASISLGILDSLKNVDTEYVHSYYPKLGIRLYEVTKFNQIRFRNNKTNKSVSYKPNDMNAIGIGVNYRWLNLGVSIPLPSLDEKIYGKTNNIDLQLNIYTRRFTVDGSLLYHKGFYMDNVIDLVPNWNKKEFPYRSDLQNMSLGGSCIYTINHKKYSYRAAFLQSEWQKKSAGSLLLGGFVLLYRMRADSSFVERSLLRLGGSTFRGMDSTSFASMLNVGFAVGYGRTIVFHKQWYVNLTLVPGIAAQLFSTRDNNNEYIIKPSVRVGARMLGRFALGVNRERYYAGVQSVFDEYILTNSKLTSFEYRYGHIRVFYGRRFSLEKKKK